MVTFLEEAIVLAALLKEPALVRFRQRLGGLFGDRFGRTVGFGSRARGDAHGGSGWGVAIFLKTLPDRWVELDRLARLRVEMIDETGAVFDAMPYLDTVWQDRSPLMREIRRDGIEL